MPYCILMLNDMLHLLLENTVLVLFCKALYDFSFTMIYIILYKVCSYG